MIHILVLDLLTLIFPLNLCSVKHMLLLLMNVMTAVL